MRVMVAIKKNYANRLCSFGGKLDSPAKAVGYRINNPPIPSVNIQKMAGLFCHLPAVICMKQVAKGYDGDLIKLIAACYYLCKCSTVDLIGLFYVIILASFFR